MKMKRGCFFLILLFVIVANVMKVNAIQTGFKINELPSEEKNMFISNINLSLVEEEPVKKAIVCFDVNSNQLIAIGQDTIGIRKTICVYSNEGAFQYGYTFDCSGSFGVEWDKEKLNIYFVRSDVVVSVTPKGEVLEALEVPYTIENNTYVNHLLYSDKRIVGDEVFLIRNNMGLLNLFAASWSQIIVKDSVGVESIIYDVSSMQNSKMIVSISLICIFVLVAAAAVIRQIVKLRRGK